MFTYLVIFFFFLGGVFVCLFCFVLGVFLGGELLGVFCLFVCFLFWFFFFFFLGGGGVLFICSSD